MPQTGEIMPESGVERIAGRGAAVLRATGVFGEVSVLSRRVLEFPGLVLVVGLGWEMGAEAAGRLSGALESHPLAAFAFGEAAGGPGGSEKGRGGAMRVDAGVLIARPRELGPVVIRCSEAARLGWPDFGPPDFVLDGAATWALAAALAVRGGEGLFVPGARSGRPEVRPESMDRLRPEGIAWLASCAMGWGVSGRPPVDMAERLWRRWSAEMGGAGFDGLTPPGGVGR